MIFEKKFSGEDMERDLQATREILGRAERRAVGFCEDVEPDYSRPDPIEEMALKSMQMLGVPPFADVEGTPKLNPPVKTKYSDAEIMFRFESRMDAEMLYSWIIENGLLAEGEIVLTMEGIEYMLHVMPHVWMAKPEVFQAIMIAYDELLYDTPEQSAAFEAFCEDLTVLGEAKRERKVKNMQSVEFGIKGNPFHDSDSGQFTSRSSLEQKGVGSRSKEHIKKKVKGKGKSLKFVFTKNPCGRDARKAGKSTRCWDGEQPGWWYGEQLSKAIFAMRHGEPIPEGVQGVIDNYLAGL